MEIKKKLNIQEKITMAVNSKRLSVKNEGEKEWFNYKLRITKLYWSRNLFDGYLIEVFDKFSNLHLETVRV